MLQGVKAGSVALADESGEGLPALMGGQVPGTAIGVCRQGDEWCEGSIEPCDEAMDGKHVGGTRIDDAIAAHGQPELGAPGTASQRLRKPIENIDCAHDRRWAGPETRRVSQMQHRAITHPIHSAWVWGNQQCLNLVPCEVIDQLRVRPLYRQRTDTQRLVEAGGRLVLKIAKECPDRSEPRVPGARGVATLFLDMIEERQHKPGIKILHGKIARPPFDPLCREADQQSEAVGVSGNGMRTGATFARQMLAQESGEVRSKSCHAAPPWNSRSLASAIECIRTGVACRYQ
jgi:hypothetical protein